MSPYGAEVDYIADVGSGGSRSVADTSCHMADALLPTHQILVGVGSQQIDEGAWKKTPLLEGGCTALIRKQP
ncbi:hypothetical protein EYF80_062506 [Liparis tanakae]|uniref:Uncharacterized protein n=1 Tax=Liparis tanakae TaxID=230148 RepID=A0A4Z2EF73_9TELE|nr:hypothetical protein EYF80_062506 [Liparis tanakae]